MIIMLKKYKVFFKRNNGEYIDLGFCEKENCLVNINKFLKEHNFKYYYTRVSKIEKGIELWDVGSHTEFFYIIENEKINKFIKDKKIRQQLMDIE